MKASLGSIEVAAALLFAAGVGVYVWKKGGLAGALAGAASNVAAGVEKAAVQGVGAVGAAVGLPTPDQTTGDPSVVRWIMDNVGYFEASKWGTAGALWSASFMGPGTGRAPAAGSLIARTFPYTANYDEAARLLARYPAPVGSTLPDNYSDPTQYGIPL